MPLTIQDVRREVRTALSRISIIDSDTIQVVSGDKPLQPSVRTGALSGVGDIFGPTLTTVQAIPLWNNTDGTTLKDSDLLWYDEPDHPLGPGGNEEFLTTRQAAATVKFVIQPGSVGAGIIGRDLFLRGGDGSTQQGIIQLENANQVRLHADFSVNITAPTIVFAGTIVLGNNPFETGGEGSGTGMSSSVDTELVFDIESTTFMTLTAASLEMATKLDLGGNKLVLSADGLSSIQSLASNLVDVRVNNVSVMNWQDNAILMRLPVNLVGDILTFNIGAEIHGSGVDDLDVLMNDVVTVQFRETATTLNTDLDLNDNELLLGATGSASLRGAADVVTLKVADKDQVVWANNLMTLAESPGLGNVTLYTVKAADAVFEGVGGTLRFHGGIGNAAANGTVQWAIADGTVHLELEDSGDLTVGDGVSAFLIVAKASSAAVGLDLTVRAGRADGGNRVGGDLFLEGGAGSGIGESGSVFIRTGSGTVLAEFKRTGEVDFAFAGMKINSNGSIAGLPSIQVDSGGIIGFDNDNKWVLTENLLHSWTINSVLAMTLADDTLDGQGTTRLTGFKGMRETFVFGYHTTSTITTQWVYAGPYAAVVTPNAKRGVWLFHAGSIISVKIVCDVNVLGTGDTLDAQPKLDIVSTSLKATIDPLSVANGLEADNSQAVGIDTFAAGTWLAAVRVLTGGSPGQVTTDDFIITIEVEYDD